MRQKFVIAIIVLFVLVQPVAGFDYISGTRFSDKIKYNFSKNLPQGDYSYFFDNSGFLSYENEIDIITNLWIDFENEEINDFRATVAILASGWAWMDFTITAERVGNNFFEVSSNGAVSGVLVTAEQKSVLQSELNPNIELESSETSESPSSTKDDADFLSSVISFTFTISIIVKGKRKIIKNY